jgi:hypothetical protein
VIALDRHDVVNAARSAAVVTALVLLVAILVRLTLAADAREWLDFEFPGIPSRFGEAVAIFVNNARLVLAVLIACFVVGQMQPVPEARRAERIGLRLGVGLFDLLLLAGVAFHVVFVGTAVGAYGTRTLDAMVPHGPFELASFCLALGLYLTARREAVPLRRIAVVGAVSLTVLAVAALLEVFLQIGGASHGQGPLVVVPEVYA